MVDAADKLAVFDVAVNDLERSSVAENKGVLTRDAAVVEHDIISLRPANEECLADRYIGLPASAGWFCNCNYPVQCIRNCKW